MKKLTEQVIDLSLPIIQNPPDFRLKLFQGFEYVKKHASWALIAPRGFVQFSLILEAPAEVRLNWVMKTISLQGVVNCPFSIAVNGLCLSEKRVYEETEFGEMGLTIGPDRLFEGENTLQIALMPHSETPLFIRECRSSFRQQPDLNQDREKLWVRSSRNEGGFF